MNTAANRTHKLVGDALKSVRTWKGLTQGDVALRWNVEQSFVSKIEQGERRLLLSELFSYSEAMGLSPDDVFETAKNSLFSHTRQQTQQDARH